MKSEFFNGKVAWITGASSGIGEALAYHLSELGAFLVLSARRTEELERVKANCRPGSQVMVLPLDLAKPGEMPQKAAAVMAGLGRIDFLINNAGIGQNSLVADTQMEVYQKVLQINFLGAVALSQAVLPIFSEQGFGHLIGISSVLGKIVIRERSCYCASKFALNAFLDTIRVEYRNQNIKVLIAYPGAVQTEIDMYALDGNGAKLGEKPKGYEKGLPPATVAKAITGAIKSGRSEITIGNSLEKLAMTIRRFFPYFYFRLV